MAIGGRAVLDTIQLKHWLTLVPETRGAQRLLVKDMKDLAERVGSEADKLLVEFKNSGIRHDILQTVRSVIETRAVHILRIVKQL